MGALDKIKNKIAELYKNDPHVHVNVTMNNPKLCIKNEPVLIKGVYPHIFQIETQGGASRKCYSVQYAELLTRNVEIVELTGK